MSSIVLITTIFLPPLPSHSCANVDTRSADATPSSLVQIRKRHSESSFCFDSLSSVVLIFLSLMYRTFKAIKVNGRRGIIHGFLNMASVSNNPRRKEYVERIRVSSSDSIRSRMVARLPVTPHPSRS